MPQTEGLIDKPMIGARAHGRDRLRVLVEHRESRHAVKYAVVGIANVTIDFVLYGLLVWLGIGYVAAKACSLVIATLNGYTFNRLWTFRAGRHRHSTLSRYVAVQALGLALNLALLAVMVELVGFGPVIAQLIAIPVVCSFTFLANRLWTFGRYVQRT
jgi:putative flippase GtrA